MGNFIMINFKWIARRAAEKVFCLMIMSLQPHPAHWRELRGTSRERSVDNRGEVKLAFFTFRSYPFHT
jgi:hypothetical protein